MEAIKKAGSTVYGARSGGKSFSWYMRFKAKKGSFSEEKFLPRWQIGFFGGMSLRIDGKDPDKHIEFIKFFEENIPLFENTLGK